MTIFQSIFLGFIQGITEFLPVSSSGHLVVVPFILGWKLDPQETFIFDVLVQVATLAAVFAYFWRDLLGISVAWLRSLRLKNKQGSTAALLGWYILLATVPAGVIGLLAKDYVEAAFDNPQATGIFLIATAALLVLAERAGKRNRSVDTMRWQDALWIGFSQALAIFPGISRSGATITGGMSRNFERAGAARFSFILSIPIMLAAGTAALVDLKDIPHTGQILLHFLPGFLTAAITGFFAIAWLLRYLTQRSLYGFAIYCALLGVGTITLTIIGGY